MLFTITIGVTGDSLESAKSAAADAVARVRAAPEPKAGDEVPPESAVAYAFHENNEHSTFSAQITRTPSLELGRTPPF
jgi:hypothetical protein